METGDILYNKRRHGFQQIKDIVGNKVILSGPCDFYFDATTNIIRSSLLINIASTMKVVTEEDLPNVPFASKTNNIINEWHVNPYIIHKIHQLPKKHWFV